MSFTFQDSYEDILPDGKSFRLTYDSQVGKMKIIARDRRDLADLIKAFSCPNPGAFFAKQFGYSMSATVSPINMFGYFGIGFTQNVLSYIKAVRGSLSCLAVSPEVISLLREMLTPLKSLISAKGYEESSFIPSEPASSIKLRKYQSDIVKALIFKGYGRGLFECPTGSGKSYIIASYIKTLKDQFCACWRYLILVPNRQLVDQFQKDLISYGFPEDDIEVLAGGSNSGKGKHKLPEASPVSSGHHPTIIISNRQYIFRNREKLPEIDVLIADEVHQVAPGSSTYELADKLGCSQKIGCSGTIPSGKYSRWMLVSLFSEIVFTEGISELQSQGYLAGVKIECVKITDREAEADKSLLFNLHSDRKFSEEDDDVLFNEAYRDEIAYINKNYSKLYSPMMDLISKLKGNVLVLFDRIEFGKNMFELAEKLNLRNSVISYIDGSTPVKEREEVRASLEKTDNNILFANVQILGTGINIKQLSNAVFFFSSKSETRIIQAIGRTMRLHEGKTDSKIIDISFNFKYSHKHLLERLGIYKKAYSKSRPDETIEIEV